MPTGPMPFPGYFDQDAADFAGAIVDGILNPIGTVVGAIF